MIRTCANTECGKIFETSQPVFQFYCSRTCLLACKPKRPCLHCGSPTINAMYCNRSCSASAVNRNWPKRKRKEPSATCGFCGIGRWPRMRNGEKVFSVCSCPQAWASRVLVEHSSPANKGLLIRYGLLKEECSKCGIGTSWQDEPIVLELDHVNGNKYDNRIENLRILCPNCHSQTATFRNKSRPDGYHKYYRDDTSAPQRA